MIIEFTTWFGGSLLPTQIGTTQFDYWFGGMPLMGATPMINIPSVATGVGTGIIK